MDKKRNAITSDFKRRKSADLDQLYNKPTIKNM